SKQADPGSGIEVVAASTHVDRAIQMRVSGDDEIDGATYRFRDAVERAVLLGDVERLVIGEPVQQSATECLSFTDARDPSCKAVPYQTWKAQRFILRGQLCGCAGGSRCARCRRRSVIFFRLHKHFAGQQVSRFLSACHSKLQPVSEIRTKKLID